MKILHIITSLRLGGAERLVADLLPRFADRGHEVELLLFDGTRTPLYEQLEQQSVRIRALGKGFAQIWNPLHYFRLRRIFKNEHFDVVHTHNTPCQVQAALAFPKKNGLLVTTEHNTFNRRRRWAWYGRIDRRMYGCYDHIVCVGEQTKRNLIEKLGEKFEETRLSVIENGIDLSRFARAEADKSLRGGEDGPKHVIIMVAAFRPQKDQATLVRAMQHLSDEYELWLVGDDPTRVSGERQTGIPPRESRVRRWGFRSDVPRLLATADVVVLSSHYEGFGLAVVEGMAASKPVIASDVEGLRDTVGGAGLLFPHEDDRKLAELIRQVCENSDFAASVAERCRARAERFGIDTVVAAYEQVYTTLSSHSA